MAQRWLKESLDLIWVAVLHGDVSMRRQAAAVCRSILELLEEPVTIPLPAAGAAVPAGEGSSAPGPVAGIPDLGELGPILAGILTGNLEPLLEKYKPLIEQYKEQYGATRPVQFRYVPVPGRDY